MNDRLPYEEQLAQQWNDLPLPDENVAWDDMKRRLEEDDDGGIIPIWLRGCGLWSLLAIVLIGIGWWLIRPDKWWNKKQETGNVKTIDQKENKNNTATRINTGDTTQVTKITNEIKSNGSSKKTSTDSRVDNSLTTINKKSFSKNNDPVSIEPKTAGTKKKRKTNDPPTVKNIPQKNKQPADKKSSDQTETGKIDISIQPASKKKDTSDITEAKTKPVTVNKDSTSVATVPVNKKDSIAKKMLSDSISKKNTETTVKTNEPKKDSSKPKTISFSAGLGLQQLLPIAGQKLNPYNSAGRKGSFADYIPSVFARMYKNDKWFLQLEFRYGAPQYTKDLLYQQNFKNDSIGGVQFTTITASKLKKTFYHQLPLTFNYFILPDWSIGTGVVWNKFVSAVSQEEVNRKNNITQVIDSISNRIITDRNDTLFKKSYFQAVFETQYRWKRFSIGARYSFGLQPYIKFTLPGDIRREERNKSLQIFLRYELWKSKAKR
jgi:hypothetical protein